MVRHLSIRNTVIEDTLKAFQVAVKLTGGCVRISSGFGLEGCALAFAAFWWCDNCIKALPLWNRYQELLNEERREGGSDVRRKNKRRKLHP